MKLIRSSSLKFIPASHEDPNNPGVWKKVLFQKDDIKQGTVQMVNWARLPKGAKFTSHYHEDMDEVFIIISGEVELIIGDTRETMRAGDAVLVGAREIHQMQNSGDSDLEYVVFGVATGKGGQTVVVE